MTDDRLDLVLRRIDVRHEPPRGVADELFAELLPVAAEAARRDRNPVWRTLGAIHDLSSLVVGPVDRGPARRLAPIAVALVLLLLVVALALIAGRQPGPGRPFVYATSDLRLVVADGSGRQRTLVEAGQAQAPVLSPDGRSAAYLSNGVSVVRIDGTERAHFAVPDTASTVTTWLTDSRHLVLEEEDHQVTGTGTPKHVTLTCRTVLADADTGETRPVQERCDNARAVSGDGRYAATLVPTDADHVQAAIADLDAGTTVRIGDPVATSDPLALAWSPSGSELALALDGDVRFLDGLGVATRPAISAPPCLTLAWSPAGTHVLCTLDDGPSPILPVDGSAPAWLTVKASQPAWSPDGSMLLYTATPLTAPVDAGQVAAADELWVVNADGTNARPIASNVDDSSAGPRWSPDGSQIAFLRGTNQQVADGNALLEELWVIRPDGSGETRVAPDAIGFDW